MGDRKEANQIVAVHNGQVFRFNEVVHIFEGTAPGVPGKKTEFTKAWFKGVDRTKAEERFICRPVIGHNGGPFPRFSKGAVFKVKVETLTLSLPHPNPKPNLGIGLGELACSLTLFSISRYLVLACWRNTGGEIVGIV